MIDEPLGGAHRLPAELAQNLKTQLISSLEELEALSTEELLEKRYNRLMSYGLTAQ